MTRCEYTADLHIAEVQLLAVLQEVIHLKGDGRPREPLRHIPGKFPVDPGHVQLGAVLLLEVVTAAIVVAMSVADHNGIQIMNIKAQILKGLFNAVPGRQIGIHAVQQHITLGCFQNKAAHQLISHQGELIKEFGCREVRQVLLAEIRLDGMGFSPGCHNTHSFSPLRQPVR